MSKHKYTDDQIREALGFDPLHTAEQITGESYKGDEPTMFMGMGLASRNNEAKARMLGNAGDVVHRMPLGEYMRCLNDDGFEQFWELEFENDHEWDTDKLIAMFCQRDGTLVVFDTFYGCKSVNGGKVYYNVKMPDYTWELTRQLLATVTSSGHYVNGEDRIWAGDHDCREAVRFHMRQFREQCEFVTPWKECPITFVTSYADHRRESSPGLSRLNNLSELSVNRMNEWPDEIKAAINVESYIDKHVRRMRR